MCTLDVERWAFSLFYIADDHFPRLRLCRKVSRRRWRFFRASAVDARVVRRLKLDAIWLELLPATNDPANGPSQNREFPAKIAGAWVGWSILFTLSEAGQMTRMIWPICDCIGISKRELLDRLAGPNVLLNLAYSIHPPLLLKFERRIFCDLDPSEIFYWMTKMEMGQSYHHEFWTIGLNVDGDDCHLPKSALPWKTFYPLVDTKFFQPRPRPREPKFTTVGQWYWGGAVEVAGEFPDLSKKFAFGPYLDLPARVPEARFELAMNIAAGDSERERLHRLGWKIVDPHRVAHTPRAYRRYLASALAEFTAIKGVDVAWRTGWISDRAAAFLALGRPVITEDTGADRYLPAENGFRFIRSVAEAEIAVREVLQDWSRLSKQARECAVEVFDSVKNLRRILDS